MNFFGVHNKQTICEFHNSKAKDDEDDSQDEGRPPPERMSQKKAKNGKKESKDESLDDVAAAGPSSLNSEDLSKAMAAYTAAISKTKDIKIS